MKRKKNSKKNTRNIFGGNDIQKTEGKEFAIVSPDEIFLFYDTLIRRDCKNREKRSVVRITGSHKHSCLFGAISIDGNKQLFRQYDKLNSQTFLEFLKTIHVGFQDVICLWTQLHATHYKSRPVKYCLEENKNTLIPVYLPTASPEFMILKKRCGISTNKICLY